MTVSISHSLNSCSKIIVVTICHWRHVNNGWHDWATGILTVMHGLKSTQKKEK